MAEEIETRPICKQQDRYIGWPTVAGALNGTIHAVFSGDRDAHVCPFGKNYLMSSKDGGLTWSEPRPTTLNGYPPHLLQVSDGRLLASFGVRHEPLGFRFCFSSDEGRTWDVAGQLHVGTDLKDLGYPATVETAPGCFLSVYYQKDRADEKPCLMMTRWRG